VDRLRREDIVRALEALAQELSVGAKPVELVVVGGAALVLLYGARETTRDVDGFVIDAMGVPPVRAAARRIAATLGLPHDWLNDGAKGYVQGLALGDVLLNTPSLVVRTLAPQQLLAMKLSAWRDDLDIEDARLLLSKLHGTRDEVWQLVAPHMVPGRELKAQYAFLDLWEEAHSAS
jgi:hypothetical protein